MLEVWMSEILQNKKFLKNLENVYIDKNFIKIITRKLHESLRKIAVKFCRHQYDTELFYKNFFKNCKET